MRDRNLKPPDVTLTDVPRNQDPRSCSRHTTEHYFLYRDVWGDNPSDTREHSDVLAVTPFTLHAPEPTAGAVARTNM